MNLTRSRAIGGCGWCILIPLATAAAPPSTGSPGDTPRVVNATTQGVDPEDATQALQDAVDSGAKTVVVPFTGKPWIVRPIKLRSNLELIFEPGVVILAKKDEFKGRGDSLFRATDATDVTLRGYGATLRMRKKDYQSEPYQKAEWRMGISLTGCRKVHIEGLRIESTGGDGIYIGCTAKLPRCEDVVIRNVVCHDNHRQGISVIGAKNLLIENCTLTNTDGTAPRAGIDFEPNHDNEMLVNCRMRNCILDGNAGPAILAYVNNLSQNSEPISISVEDCYVRGGSGDGIVIGAVRDDGPDGAIEFKNCTIENTDGAGLSVYDKSADRCRLRFVNCKWNAVGVQTKPAKAPLLVNLRRSEKTEKTGGIDFIDCTVFDALDRPVLFVKSKDPNLTVADLQGRITVHSPHGARTEVQGKTADVNLNVVSNAN